MSNQMYKDNKAVDRIAGAMKYVLEKKREQGYGGWDDTLKCNIPHLEHLLEQQLNKKNRNYIHIANFVAMIWNHRYIELMEKRERVNDDDLPYWQASEDGEELKQMQELINLDDQDLL